MSHRAASPLLSAHLRERDGYAEMSSQAIISVAVFCDCQHLNLSHGSLLLFLSLTTRQQIMVLQHSHRPSAVSWVHVAADICPLFASLPPTSLRKTQLSYISIFV